MRTHGPWRSRAALRASRGARAVFRRGGEFAKVARKASQLRRAGLALSAVVVTLGFPWSALAAPPKVVSISPPPKDWIVSGAAFQQVNVQFDSPVIVVDDAVSLRTLDLGLVIPVVGLPLGFPTTSLTVSFPPIAADRATLVLTDLIVNQLGEALDGEIASPHTPILPSGNGAVGGSSVFQFSVLKGDVNRDGIVDSLDFSKLRAAMVIYDPLADLNSDGRIDAADEAIVLNGAGVSISKTDHSRPTVVTVSPGIVPLSTGEIVVTFSEVIDVDTVNEQSVYVVGANGAMLHASGPPQTQDGLRFIFPFADVACEQNYDVGVSNALADLSGELLLPPAAHRLFGEDEDPPTLACPLVTYVNSTTPFAISAAEIPGIAAIQAFLRGPTASDTCSTRLGSVAIASSLDNPTTDLPLGVNTVTFTATDEAGNVQTCDSFLIVVPAVPLPPIQGPQGSQGGQGPPGVAGQNGAQGDPGKPGEPGTDGDDGASGDSCWDLNGNGLADPAEDRNEDGVVNVLDCQGEPGPQGPSGQDGVDGSNGTDGTNGTDPPAGEPVPDGSGAGTTTPICGALGMINLAFLLTGLCAAKFRRTRGL